jgi:N6-adenosine-specific RNA methylase IME4
MERPESARHREVVVMTAPRTPAATLSDLALRIKAEHEATIAGIRRSMDHALRVGDLLIEAKGLLEHGQWLPWLEENTSIKPRLAQTYMRLAHNREQIEAQAKCGVVAYLTIPDAMQLLAPDDDPAEQEREILQAAKEIRAVKSAENHAKWTERTIELSKTTSPLPCDRRYPIIYADPPWEFHVYDRDSGSTRCPEAHYPTMPTEDICAMPVEEIATPDAVLFLWTTAPKLPESLRVIEAWGFKYVTHMVWVKHAAGLGYWVRNQHELLIIGSRGNMRSPPGSARPASVIQATRREHSRKPDEAYEMIEGMFPDLPKIELFARNARKGWAAWGNQAPGQEA